MYQQSPLCCTLNNVPMTAASLQKSRLPFAIHLFPFANDENVPVINDAIVRCHICRAYINPYVRIEQRSWQCCICNRTNELPLQFNFDSQRQQYYYDYGTKAELTNETVEYVASQEYMVRPPPPAAYIFVFDCSRAAVETGYIPVMATAIADLLDQMPGDSRASIGFIGYDSCVHFFSFIGTQVVQHTNPDISSVTIPCPIDGILANLVRSRNLIIDFLTQRLATFPNEGSISQGTETRSALGTAIKTAVKILAPIGGRITILQAQLANYGCDDGSALVKREDPSTKKNMTSDKNGEYLTPLINASSDYYKTLALEACELHISIDLFNLATTYTDLSTVSHLCKFTAGAVFHYSNSINERKSTLIRFDQDLRKQLERPAGLEAVLRVRHSRGLRIASFHGNFFVRTNNLLALPGVNPDAGFSLQIAIEDDLSPSTSCVYFQSCLLYTTPEAERRIRVHTARFRTVTTLPEVIYGANQSSIIAILAKMAVERSQQASIGEAKEALIGAGVDILEIFSIVDEMRSRSYPFGLPENLRLIPLYILALLKHTAFKISTPVSLDDRYAAMERFSTLPVDDLITYIYPDLFPLHGIENDANDDWRSPIQLTAAHIERNGAYLLDAYDVMIIYICEFISPKWCYEVFGVNDFTQIQEVQDVFPTDHTAPNSYTPRNSANFTVAGTSKDLRHDIYDHISAAEVSETSLVGLPELDNVVSIKIREFINWIIEERPQKPKFYIIKEKSRAKTLFTQYLIDDRSESYHSYAEFWKFLQDQARK